MGRVYAWRLKKWNGSGWDFGYSWLTRDPSSGFSTSIPSNSTLSAAGAYAAELSSRAEYEAAFSRMLANIGADYRCTTNFGSWEDYYYNACEWGVENGYCGVQPPSKSITLSFEPTTSSGSTFHAIIRTVAIAQSNVQFYVNGGPDVFEQTPKTSRQIAPGEYEYDLLIEGIPVGSHYGEAKSGSVTSGRKTFTRTEGSYSLSFDPSSTDVSAESTSATTRLESLNVTNIQQKSCSGCSASNSGDNWTVTYPINTGATETSAKTYKLTVGGTRPNGTEITASFTVNQAGYTPPAPECTPGIDWASGSKNKEVASTSTSYTFNYEILVDHCCPDGVEVTSSNNWFTPGTPANGSVTVTYNTNTDVSNPKTTTLTVICKKSGYTSASGTTTFTQKAMDVNGSITITSGSTSAPVGGASQSYTARADYVVWDGAVSSDNTVTITNIQNTGSTSTGTSGVNVTFTVNFPSIAVTGTTDVPVSDCSQTVRVTTPGYNSGTYSSGTLTVCAPTKTVTITVYGKDKNNTRKSDTITITQA